LRYWETRWRPKEYNIINIVIEIGERKTHLGFGII